MHCPKCDYNLTGTEGNTCPECGTHFAVVSAEKLNPPNVLMLTGVGMIALYCLAQIVSFWSERRLAEELRIGFLDPAELETYAGISRWGHYASNLSLGVGLLCVAVALFQTFRRAIIAFNSSSRST